MANVPLMFDNLPEAVDHAIVVIGAGSLACLQLPGMLISTCQQFLGAERLAHTLVLTTSRGYLDHAISIQQQSPGNCLART